MVQSIVLWPLWEIFLGATGYQLIRASECSPYHIEKAHSDKDKDKDSFRKMACWFVYLRVLFNTIWHMINHIQFISSLLEQKSNMSKLWLLNQKLRQARMTRPDNELGYFISIRALWRKLGKITEGQSSVMLLRLLPAELTKIVWHNVRT